MKLRFLNLLWHRIRSSFWFVPALMTFGAIFLSIITLGIDRFWFAPDGNQRWWLFNGGPDGARLLLSTIAGSMITVAGVVFSITIVVLSLASSQFGPRLIRNFMETRINQTGLGTFIGTFVFCIMILQNIGESGDDSFVPLISVYSGTLLSLASLGVLIYFIHSVSTSIRANSIIARVCKELDHAIDKIFPEKNQTKEPRDALGEKRGYVAEKYYRDIVPVMSRKRGYIQAIDIDEIVDIAVGEDVIIRIDHRPGDFIVTDNPLLWMWPGKRSGKQLEKKLEKVFVVGSERTSEQDIEYPVHLLVEIAVRALSPGVNDPYTAMACIDWLGEALSKLARRKMHGPFRFDQEGNLRVISKPITFSGAVDAAFNQIRQNSAANPAVSIRLLEAVAAVSYQADENEKSKPLRQHAEMIYRSCRDNVEGEKDMADIQARYERVLEILNKPRLPDGESILGNWIENRFMKAEK